ncbi:hypothetical protein LO772_12255 [Yinghuangia sp. ASG 101]|uniref:hypothetical protein n=1 Tax=Yinghuangia sp. ASG 101 TaxID=2896848 RepID=UPI001E48F92A|nr:hypothetical protein [Yinghuangia sp. ASG 101]UGQ14288.1 hypothetical protein LO772_12255 [Yinghuangia sp. ASG 101]
MTDSSPPVHIEPFFLHAPLAISLVSPQSRAPLVRDLRRAENLYKRLALDNISNALTAQMIAAPPPDLNVLLAEGQEVKRNSVVLCEQVVTFSGVAAALRGQNGGRAQFRGELAGGEAEFVADFSVEHFTSTSAQEFIRGKRTAFILAYIQDTHPRVKMRPIVIGQRIWWPGKMGPLSLAEPLEMHPALFDAFSGVDWRKRLRSQDLEVMRNVPEEKVKEAFAQLIGEPDVPLDWGGESSDLFSARVSVEGSFSSAAFLFKGPAKFAPMTVAMLGKNGDQISRLASEPAEILVVQHCHSVKPAVRTLLMAFALNAWNPRRYAIFDGYDTLRILRHFGYV